MGEESDIMWAIKTGDVEVVQAKLKTKADAEREVCGRMPLHYAADFGQVEVVKHLITLGADVNATDRHGITPLLAAVYEGHGPVVKILLEKEANKTITGPDGKSAIESTESDDIKALLQ